VPALVAEGQLLSTLLQVLDLVGTFVFALSGAAVGVRRRLDLFGVLVLSFVAASSGGIARDVMIGAVPPAALTDWRYLAVSTLAGLTTFYGLSTTTRRPTLVLVTDAAGLALFAVAGTLKALAYGLGPFSAPLLGVVTGIGGGVVRDILVSEVPAVFRGEIYAVAALGGSVVVVAGVAGLGWPQTPVAVAGAVLCFALRMISVRRQWQLPVAGGTESRPTSAPATRP
jgi:uncharacterized membrane protein YeiH